MTTAQLFIGKREQISVHSCKKNETSILFLVEIADFGPDFQFNWSNLPILDQIFNSIGPIRHYSPCEENNKIIIFPVTFFNSNQDKD